MSQPPITTELDLRRAELELRTRQVALEHRRCWIQVGLACLLIGGLVSLRLSAGKAAVDGKTGTMVAAFSLLTGQTGLNPAGDGAASEAARICALNVLESLAWEQPELRGAIVAGLNSRFRWSVRQESRSCHDEAQAILDIFGKLGAQLERGKGLTLEDGALGSFRFTGDFSHAVFQRVTFGNKPVGVPPAADLATRLTCTNDWTGLIGAPPEFIQCAGRVPRANKSRG